MNESEKRVKEVYPNAIAQSWGGYWWINNGRSFAVKDTLSGEFVSVDEAWADAASRLPKEEVDTSESAAHPALKDTIYAMIAEVVPPPLTVSETAVAQLWPLLEELIQRRSASHTEQEEPAPQTFEEWWEVYRPQFDTYSAVGWKGVARAAWNAAKASSPAVAGGESEEWKSAK